MKPAGLLFTSAANRDFSQIVGELEERAGARVAGRWLREIRNRARQLLKTPLMGQTDEGLGGRRRLVVTPYLIVYDLTSAGEVQIVRILHGARDMPALFYRDRE